MELPAVNQRTASEQRHSMKNVITSPKASSWRGLTAADKKTLPMQAVWPFFLKLMLQECVFSAT